MSHIEAKPISGFKEFLPEEQLELERLKRIIARHFELFGFTPIEVPAVERVEVLLAKSGENTKQIYGIHLLERSDQDVGDPDKALALHFDLTVPLARYVAQNYGKLDFPFRRYQIQKAWRGERPQEGRFREFYQCDIDVIGDGQLGLLHDAEMPAVIHGIFADMQIGPYLIRLNNRKIHNGLLTHLGIPLHFSVPVLSEATGEVVAAVQHNTLTLIDRMEKDGSDETQRVFRDHVGATAEQVSALMQVLTFKEDMRTTLQWLHSWKGNELFAQGVAELTEVVGHMHALGVPDDIFAVDLGITRGLDYYTGTVYETSLLQHQNIGSICSGGRFDNLAENFTDRKLPGVGISIGLTRLFWALLHHAIIVPGARCPTTVVIFQLSPDLQAEYFALATRLRQQGIAAEVYLEDRKVDKQTKYAVKKHIPYGIFLDAARRERGECTVRHYKNGNEETVSLESIGDYFLKCH